MKKYLKHFVIALIAYLSIVTIVSAGSLLKPGVGGGLLIPLNFSGLVITVASPLTVSGTSSSTITGDGSVSTIGGGLTVSGQLKASSSVVYIYRLITASTTLSSDYFIGIGTSTNLQITLPSATTTVGLVYIIKDVVNIASSTTSTITTATSTQGIDGAGTTTTIPSLYGIKRFFSNGSNWFTW